jgi:hypothetical protein
MDSYCESLWIRLVPASLLRPAWPPLPRPLPFCLLPYPRSAHPLENAHHFPDRSSKIQTKVTVAIATFLLTVLPFVRILPRLQHAFDIPSAPEMPHHRAPWPSGAFSCSYGGFRSAMALIDRLEPTLVSLGALLYGSTNQPINQSR